MITIISNTILQFTCSSLQTIHVFGNESTVQVTTVNVLLNFWTFLSQINRYDKHC